MGITPQELDAAVKACAAQHYGLTDTEVQKAILLGFRLLRRFLVDLFKMKKEHPNVYAAVFSDSNGGDDDDNGAFARSFNGSAFEGFTSDESDGDDDAANEGKQAAGKDDDDYEGAAAARDAFRAAHPPLFALFHPKREYKINLIMWAVRAGKNDVTIDGKKVILRRNGAVVERPRMKTMRKPVAKEKETESPREKERGEEKSRREKSKGKRQPEKQNSRERGRTDARSEPPRSRELQSGRSSRRERKTKERRRARERKRAHSEPPRSRELQSGRSSRPERKRRERRRARQREREQSQSQREKEKGETAREAE